MFGQLVDRIAAVEQDALVAVDIGDRGFAACRGGEAGVVGEGAGLAVERADVDDLRAHRSREHVIIVALPAEGEAGLFVRHAYCSLFVILSSRRARLSSRPSSTSTSKIPGEVARPVKIGRASCRERVCQYV